MTNANERTAMTATSMKRKLKPTQARTKTDKAVRINEGLFVENKRTLTGAQIHFATETDAGRPTPTRNAEYSVPNDKAPGATIITKAAVINTIMGPMTGTMVITTAAVVTIATEETATVTGTDTLIRINGGMAIRTMTTAAMTIL